MTTQARNESLSSDGDQGFGEIDIQRYLLVIREHILKILLLSIIVSGFAFLFFSSSPPLYRSTSIILIEESNLVSNVVDELYSQSGYRMDSMLVRIEVLQSEDLARRVVKKLGLIQYPELNPFHPDREQSFSLLGALGIGKSNDAGSVEVSEEEAIAATARVLVGSISVQSIPRSAMVRVSVDSSNPKLAAMIANGVADAYVEKELDTNLETARVAATGLSERMVALKAQLDDSESELQEFMDSNDIVERNLGEGSMVSKELDLLSQKLLDARSERIEREASYKQLRGLKQISLESLSAIPSIVNDPSVRHLKQAEIDARIKASSLSQRYGPKHPTLISAQLELSLVKDQLFDQMKTVADFIEQQYHDALSKENQLQGALKEKREEAKRQNRIEFQLNEYRRNFSSDQELYRAFFDRVREATEFSDLLAAKAKIISPAPVPRSPIKPKVAVMTMVAFFVTLAAGIALVVLVEVLDATIKDPNDVGRKLGHPLLSVIPLIDEDMGGDSVIKAFVQGNDKRFVESVRTLRTSLALAGIKEPIQVILMTSTVASEGKTTMSANLAEAYGQMEKTILIDADMRKPSLAKSLEISPNSKGLSNAVAYPETLEECIHSLPGLGVDVIPSGPMPPNPLELLSSKNFENILETLKGRYSKIIIDSAPSRIVSDALFLSSLVDGVVYVVKSDSTPDRAVAASLSKFQDSNARVLGVLLNQFDIEKGQRYSSYSYYGGYYEGYGPEEVRS